MATPTPKVEVINTQGQVVAEIKGCTTIRGARGKMARSSCAFHSDWTIRITARVS